MSLLLNRKSKINYGGLILSLLILFSNPMWFTWNYRIFYILFFSGLLILFLLPRIRNNIRILYSQLVATFVFFLYFCVFSSLLGGVQTYFFLSFSVVLLWPLIYENEKKFTLSYLTTFLTCLMLISFIPWFINTYLFSLPSFGTIGYYESKGMDVVIQNYILFIQVEHDFLIRFYSVFDEPGTIGTLIAFVLYGNKYNFKDKRNVVLLISAVFTFSLAFYILLGVGIVIQKVKGLKTILLYGFLLTIVGISIVYFLQNDATFNVTVLDRFNNIGDSMESRESRYLVVFYENFVNTQEFFYGKGRDFLLEYGWMFTGQSYKFFILEFGILGLLVLFLTYFSFIKVYNTYTIGLLILFTISFIQRPFALLSWQILLFIVILANGRLIDKKS